MKRFFYLSLFLLTTVVVTAQTLFVANNNPGAATGVNVFTGTTAIADAMTAAADGDIIYIVPSQVQYPNVTITKELTLFGIGLSPNKDLGAKSIVGDITVNSSNIRLSGIIGRNLNFAPSVPISGITIENCNLAIITHQSLTQAIDQLLIRNNILTTTLGSGIILQTTSNVTITNNIIYCRKSNGAISGAVLMVFNNLFVGNGDGTDRAFGNIDDCIINHNIFYGAKVGLLATATGNIWSDNLSFGSTNDVFDDVPPNSTGSPNLESMDPLFVNLPLSIQWLDEYDITLMAGSPALNYMGTDIGPSGGPTPFDDEGNLLPLIETVTIPAVIPVGADLPVTIKAKGN
jgi:nitrous oxidase accessory protein NosD